MHGPPNQDLIRVLTRYMVASGKCQVPEPEDNRRCPFKIFSGWYAKIKCGGKTAAHAEQNADHSRLFYGPVRQSLLPEEHDVSRFHFPGLLRQLI